MLRESMLQAAWRMNRKIPLLLAGLLVLNLLIYFVPLRIVARQADEVQRDYILLQAAERNPSRSQLSPAELYAQDVKGLRRFKAAIPDQKELSGLVDELSRLSEKSGLVIKSVNYDADTDKELKLLHYKISFQVDGNYTQVKKLVQLIEQSKRLMVIDALALDSASAKDNVSLRLQLTTYFRTDGHEPAA